MKFLWGIVIILIIIFMPLIPYENEIQMGVVTVEYQNIFSVAKERYETIQARRVGVVSPEVPEVQGEDLGAKTEHAK